MTRWRRIGFRGRLMLLAIGPTLLVAVALGWYMTAARLQDLDRAVRERGNAVAQELAAASVYGLFSGNTASLEALARSVLNRTDVVSVIIRDKDNKVLIKLADPELDEYARPGSPAYPKLLSFSAPVHLSQLRFGDDPSALLLDPSAEMADPSIGSLSILLRDTVSGPRQTEILKNAVLITLLVVCGAALIAAWLSRSLTVPIRRLTDAVQRLSNGDLSTTVEVSSAGEIGTLEAGFNTMATRIDTHNEQLNRQIEEATSELLETLNELEERNIQLNLTRREAVQASRVKSEFLARMSHEIRTPMNGVIGFTRLLGHTALSRDQQQYVRTIGQSASSLVEVINDILDFSKFEASQPQLKAVPFSLRACFQDAITLLRPAAHGRNLELVMLIYADVPDRLVGDPTRIRQILINLVSNAIKFTHQGEVVVRVMLEEQEERECGIRFTVADTGIGIPEFARDQIFRPFHQVSSAADRGYGGTGLGLSISRKLARAMGGEIEFESQEGRGSTFSVTLKLQSQPGADGESPGTELAGRRILLADSHRLSQLALLHQLRSWRIAVETVDTPSDIAESLAGDGLIPDAVILGFGRDDVRTDRLSPILAIPRDRHIPTLVLLSASAQTQLDRVCELGASACLPKPIAGDLLYRSLCSLLAIEHAPTWQTLPTDQAGTSFSGCRFLVVDDNDINRLLIATQLSRTGAEVAEAEDGERALARLAREDFDLIFMDVHMPGLSGLETTARIREQEAPGSHVPIIALTADVLPSTQQEVLLAGMDGFLAKPMEEEALWAMIQSHVRSSDTAIPTPPRHPAMTAEDDALAREMFSRFLAELPQAHDALQTAYRDGNRAALRAQAHRLRGAALYCHCPALNEVLHRVESATDDADLAMIVTKIDREVERLLGAADDQASVRDSSP